jgi:hypothetical protein
MSEIIKLAAAAGLGVGVLAFAGGAASARIICNDDGDCWHSHDEFAIVPGLNLSVHPDDWSWGDSHRYHWREHEGRGYWHGGEWRRAD